MKIKKKKFKTMVANYEDRISTLKWCEEHNKKRYHCWRTIAFLSLFFNGFILGILAVQFISR